MNTEKMKGGFHRILLTRMKYIGDIVLMTPIIRATRTAYPTAYIAFLGESNAVSLLAHNPDLDDIIGFDFKRDSVAYTLSVVRELRQKKFDLVIDFYSNPRSAILAYATGAPVRVGLDTRLRGRLFTTRVQGDGLPKTAIEFYHQLLRTIGVVSEESATKIFFTTEELNDARSLLVQKGIAVDRPVVALHPGGTWAAKLWPKERFRELAARFGSDGCAVVITGGANDIAIVHDVGGLAGLPVLLDLPLRQLAAVLSQCGAVVSNDCGTMHIAVASGIPTIGIFGPGDEKIWFPYGEPHLAFRRNVLCQPCHLDYCNRTGSEYMECMSLIGVDEVYVAVCERIVR